MKKEFLYASMALGLMFTACNSDDIITPEEPGNGVAEADQTLYVSMAIKGDMGTRAAEEDGNPEDGTDDFDPGTDESEVYNAYFVFYDDNGSVVGDYVPVTLSNPEIATSPDGTIEKYYKNVVPVGIRKGENMPTLVVCYINPMTPTDLTKPLYEVQTVTRKEVTRSANNKTYFAMSNSVYYANADAATPPTVAQRIASDQLFDTKEAADKATVENKGTIQIWVERYASKLAFSYDADQVADYVTNTMVYAADGTITEPEVTLTFVPERWALNAEANETYVVKSFRKPSSTGVMLSDNYSYSEANTAINGALSTANAWTWNNPDYHRSFWCCSPAYFTAQYPEVAGDVNDETLHQKYYTYNDLKGGAGFGADVTAAQYFRETTVGQSALNSSNPAAAMPSVILVGHYTMTIGESADEVNTDFYTYTRNSKTGNPYVYFPATENSAASKVAGGESMLKRFFMELTCLYKKVGENNYVRYNPLDATDLATLTAALEVAKPSAAVIGDMKVPARYQTLQFKAGANTADIYVANGNGYNAIVASTTPAANQVTLTTANKVVMQQVGFCNYYMSDKDETTTAGGKAYFNIPVRHYGWYRPGNAQTPGKPIDWSKVMVGDFGMVRNHSYKVNVAAITGLATGIGGYDDPIVPPADTKDQYISYKVNILKWAVVPTQNVTLN